MFGGTKFWSAGKFLLLDPISGSCCEDEDCCLSGTSHRYLWYLLIVLCCSNNTEQKYWIAFPVELLVLIIPSDYFIQFILGTN